MIWVGLIVSLKASEQIWDFPEEEITSVESSFSMSQEFLIACIASQLCKLISYNKSLNNYPFLVLSLSLNSDWW